MKSAGKARNNGLYRHIRTSKEIIRNLLNDSNNNNRMSEDGILPIDIRMHQRNFLLGANRTAHDQP